MQVPDWKLVRPAKGPRTGKWSAMMRAVERLTSKEALEVVVTEEERRSLAMTFGYHRRRGKVAFRVSMSWASNYLDAAKRRRCWIYRLPNEELA